MAYRRGNSDHIMEECKTENLADSRFVVRRKLPMCRQQKSETCGFILCMFKSFVYGELLTWAGYISSADGESGYADGNILMVSDCFLHACASTEHAHAIILIQDMQSRNLGIYRQHILIPDRQMKRARPCSL